MVTFFGSDDSTWRQIVKLIRQRKKSTFAIRPHLRLSLMALSGVNILNWFKEKMLHMQGKLIACGVLRLKRLDKKVRNREECKMV